uniref:MULE transposase domain-containing protein n=1 Tax=Arundo donax TaxID=35708 RepID=A0A0A9HXW0_ARUDO
MFFCALNPCIDGFATGCRPYLSIDSTALNGRWNGHLAAATAIDGHNWMYPIAYGFIDSETEDNWIWFMTQLQKTIGSPPHLAICTDACKGLENAVKNVFPHADQRECFWHLMRNFIKHFHGDGYGLMWSAARSYRKDEFEKHMSTILNGCPGVWKYLHDHHNLNWMRCVFNPAIKCDFITNNLVETFNNWIRDIKDLPVVDLADKLREMIMTLWEKRRISERLQGRILPAIKQQLHARTRGLGHIRVVKSNDWSAEVRNNKEHERHVVKTKAHVSSGSTLVSLVTMLCAL